MMESKDDMFTGKGFRLNSQGFVKPSRTAWLDRPSKKTTRQPVTLWLGASALLVAAAVNLVLFVAGVFSHLAADYEESLIAAGLVGLSLSTIFLVVLPLWTGIAALRGSETATGWATLYFVAEFLVDFQNANDVRFLIAVLALAAAILLWIPTTRAYSRAPHSRGSKNVRVRGQGFVKRVRTPWLTLRLKRKGPRPLTLWFGTSALLVAAAVNLVLFVAGVFSLLSQGFEESIFVVGLVALSLGAVVLVVLPLLTGIAALRGSATAARWATFYFVAEFLAAVVNLDPVEYLTVPLALAAAILLWIPATRAYSRGSWSTHP